MLTSTLLIARLDLRRRLRDRSALVVGLLAPFALASIVSLAFGAGESFSISLGLVDEDGTDATTAIVDGLVDGLAGSAIEATVLADAATARAAVDDDELDAAVVIPSGFAASLGQRSAEPLVVIRDANRQVSGDVATAIAEGVASQVDVGRLSVTATLAAGAAVDDLDSLIRRASGTEPSIRTTDELSEGEGDLSAYFGPSMAILFLFFTVGSGARSLITERRTGTLRRVLAAPISPRSVLAGKTLATLAVGFAGLLTLWGAMTVVFGSDWGDPVGVTVLSAATVAAIAGISSLVAALGRTDSQADALTSMVAFGFALLGGNFLVPAVMPDLLQTLALLTPNGWALRGFAELSLDGTGVSALGVELAVLVAMGLGTGGIALGVFARRLRP